MFSIFINDLLEKLHSSKLGANIEAIYISALGFADDIALFAGSREKLQSLIDICTQWSSNNGMAFNTSKCKIMILNTVYDESEAWNLLDNSLGIVDIYKYLGVIYSNSRLTSLYTCHMKKILEKAEERANCVRSLGFVKDGLRPIMCIEMYKVLIRPILEYAAQIISFRHYYFTSDKDSGEDVFISMLEKFQNRVLKRIIPCPRSTPPALIRLFTGVEPMITRIYTLKLRYFWKLSHAQSGDSLAQQIYQYKRASFKEDDVGFVREIYSICKKQGNFDVWEGLCSRKENPFKKIRRIVERHHFDLDLKKAYSTPTLYTNIFLLQKRNMIQKYKFESFFMKMGLFKDSDCRRCFLYELFDHRPYIRQCPWCKERSWDLLQHKLSQCLALKIQRQRMQLKFILYNADKDFDFGNKDKLFRLALSRKIFLQVLSKFLLETSNIKGMHSIQ